jgi:hypothetical protein
MKLSQLASKPQLIKITIDEEAIVEKYGEAVEFWIYDRYDMDVYMQLLNTEESDIKKLTDVVKDMLFDEDANKIITDGEVLPADILIKVIEKTVSHLGNGMTQTSEK